MTIEFGYEVIGTYPVEIEIDEEELQDEGWDEMTTEEKIDYLRENYEFRLTQRAESECEFSIGSLEQITIDKEEYWLN